MSGTKPGFRNRLTLGLAAAWIVALLPVSAGQSTPPPSAAAVTSPSLQVGDTLKLVTEFDVNGLKVLVKRREGSQTVAAALFIRGGARNITADNAGVETLML